MFRQLIFCRRNDSWIPEAYVRKIDEVLYWSIVLFFHVPLLLYLTQDETILQEIFEYLEEGELCQTLEHADPQLAVWERHHLDITQIKYIERIELGKHEIECWYYSP